MRSPLPLTLLLALCTSAVASAGPLQWAWAQTVSPMAGKNTLFAVNRDDPTKGYTFRFDPSYSDDPGPIVPPGGTPAAASIGATSFRYWHQDGYPFNWEPTDAPADPNAGRFRVSITATELTPGASYSSPHDFVGTLSYRVGASGEVIPDVAWDESRVVMGLNEYDFDIRMQGNYNADLNMLFVGSEWEMRLRGSEPGGGGEGPGNGGEVPPGVPEPGTLIIGGIALAGGVGAWWRRRAK